MTLTPTQVSAEHEEKFEYKHLAIDWPEMLVSIDSKPVHLTPLEFRLLAMLVRRRGWVVTYEQALTDVWGPSYVADRANLKLYIWYLRQKIERDPSHPELIITRRGLGYIFGSRTTAAA
ncbi:MAG: winged helix-turn-helix transcriptional regulator [Chloroflexi bacterium]|nr:winged helix-turn-helix transcriptional regulator [Chloroflexota bacterium]MCH7952248.1 winged helix-turn-helix transcriptional regulator [Chloroflexota bacterium]MCH8200288.1 winged helix-turn-helix transcriptional regulator [Chloroflexota bacterium]MCI0783149.1 winged helix-turn-helix transcriptional regulator [Chloroflexota bacterium]MCI0818022.1 winged helix-turn-helix transcriptional regulator [Chloroflexota bacterium]